MPEEPFYAGGLRFSCTRCSVCCRRDPGSVFLSATDLRVLAGRAGLSPEQFSQAYCRWVPGNRCRLSLKEKANYDCVFWQDGGCSVYEARPRQCRSFPFWGDVMCSPAAWEAAAADCPGMGRGETHTRAEIESWLDQEDSEPVLEKLP
ncbi:MAG: YkgJ family cysteine cluster protein [Treponema sp.]|jgi:Fe-S-cluster containining protein|nr:YkgJ family cysteine cluster protein [Treponema sp.]